MTKLALRNLLNVELIENKPQLRLIGFWLGLKALAPVVRRLDNAIHRINLYPVDKCLTKQTTLSAG